MLLRKLFLLLLVANIGYWAYAQGWLEIVIGTDASQREPARLTKQLNADAITITTAAAPAQTQEPPPCAATNDSAIKPASERWIIYMGPYANKTLLDKKKAELERLKVAAADIAKPSLKLGLTLGDYASEHEARAALQALTKHSVKTATVLLWSTAAASVICN